MSQVYPKIVQSGDMEHNFWETLKQPKLAAELQEILHQTNATRFKENICIFAPVNIHQSTNTCINMTNDNNNIQLTIFDAYYKQRLQQLKARYRQVQKKAASRVNEELLRDIDCGLWDNCLCLDYTNYRSVISATSLNATVEVIIRNSQSIQQNTPDTIIQ